MNLIDLTGEEGVGRRRDATVCVIAPYLALGVMIESNEPNNGGDIHLHPSGQGFWIARLLAQLGCRAVLCAPTGGEAGAVLRSLVPRWGVELASVDVSGPSVCSIEDRRNGTPVRIASEQPLEMRRHDVDQFFDEAFETALRSDATVITGRATETCVPLTFYERLGEDLAATGAETIGDLHGPELAAYLELGRLSILKVSDEDLVKDGVIVETTEAEILTAVAELAAQNVSWLIVSRAEQGAIVSLDGRVLRAQPPILRAVDHRGSGDSMTAALTAALVRGLDGETAVRLGCAAGAANVTRHGLGSASSGLIEQLSHHVRIQPLEVPV